MRGKATLALAAVLTAMAATSAAAQTWRTVSKSRRLGTETSLDVSIEYAVGRLEVKRGADRLLYRLYSQYDEEAFRFRSSYLGSEGRGRLRIAIDGHQDIELKGLKDYDLDAGRLQLDLTGTTPLDLRVKLGAAEADLDLGGLKLLRLQYETGASETQIRFSEPNSAVAEACSFKVGAASFKAEKLGNSGCRRIDFSGGVADIELDFGGEWRHDVSGQIKVGLGSVKIQMPAEIGVKIERSTFLMSFDAPGFEKRDGAWYSRNWETAAHHLTLEVSGAFGSVEIERL